MIIFLSLVTNCMSRDSEGGKIGSVILDFDYASARGLVQIDAAFRKFRREEDNVTVQFVCRRVRSNS